MPRQARLDAPGTLHHVIVRGIERRRIVDDELDRRKFLDRVGELALATDTRLSFRSALVEPWGFGNVQENESLSFLGSEARGPLCSTESAHAHR